MSRRRKDPLRRLTAEERRVLEQIARAQSEPASHVARAKMLLAVADGKTYQAAAQAAGRRSYEAVSHLVERFNQEGLLALARRAGGGAPRRYQGAEQKRILAEFRRLPDREKDGTATWSLLTSSNAPSQDRDPDEIRQAWQPWYEGLSNPPELPQPLPVLRALLVLDNLAGHKTPTWVTWCFQHGIALLYTPLGSSWLNMGESIQRILPDRALNGHHPSSAEEIIAWLEAEARGWNQDPTPFVWGGKRAARRQRARKRQQALAGSGACVSRIRHSPSILDRWRNTDKVGK